MAVDIDGVIADPGHRLHLVEGRPKNWRGFFRAAGDDPPLDVGVQRVRQLVDSGMTAMYVSGRPEYLRRVTERWLQDHALPQGPLYLRPRGDFRPAPQLKLDLYTTLRQQFDVALVIDDDVRVVEVLRAAGFTVEHADWFAPTSHALSEAQDDAGRT